MTSQKRLKKASVSPIEWWVSVYTGVVCLRPLFTTAVLPSYKYKWLQAEQGLVREVCRGCLYILLVLNYIIMYMWITVIVLIIEFLGLEEGFSSCQLYQSLAGCNTDLFSNKWRKWEDLRDWFWNCSVFFVCEKVIEINSLVF